MSFVLSSIVHPSHGLAQAPHVFEANDRLEGDRGVFNHAIEDLTLLCLRGVFDFDLQHETIDLGRGQGIGPFLLDGILRRHYKKGMVYRIGLVADGDLSFLHGFEKCALDFGQDPVDCIREDENGKDGALLRNEVACALVVDERAREIGGKKIWGELKPF